MISVRFLLSKLYSFSLPATVVISQHIHWVLFLVCCFTFIDWSFYLIHWFSLLPYAFVRRFLCPWPSLAIDHSRIHTQISRRHIPSLVSPQLLTTRRLPFFVVALLLIQFLPNCLVSDLCFFFICESVSYYVFFFPVCSRCISKSSPFQALLFICLWVLFCC